MDRPERIAVGARGERLAVGWSEPPGGAPLALVWLHGFGSRRDGEKATSFRTRALAAGWAFCAFDFRGHGESDGALRDLTLTRTLEDLAAVRSWLARRGVERLALCGSSMGGATALWQAAEAPAGLVALALIAPALELAASFARWAGPQRLARWRRDGSIRFADESVDGVLGWELMEDLRRYDPAGLAPRHRVPALVFQGQRDESVDWRAAARFAAAAAPGTVRLRLFPDGDHRLLDRRDLLWREAQEWFAGHLGRERDGR